MAAVYTSMCIDKVLDQVWTPQYFSSLQQALSGNRDVDEALQASLVELAQSDSKGIARKMKKRATFMLLLVAGLLLVSGHMDGVENRNSDEILLISDALVLLSVLSFLVIFMFGKYVFRKWKYALYAVFSVFLFSIVGAAAFYHHTELASDVRPYASAFVLAVLVLPVIWQAMVCWLNSSVFLGYLKNNLKEAKNDFDKAVYGISKHDSSIAPKKYQQISRLLPFEDTGEKTPQEISLQKYKQNYEAEIRKICQHQSFCILMGSYLQHQFQWILKGLRRILPFNGVLKRRKTESATLPVSPIVSLDYSVQFEEYKKEKEADSSIKIQQFCANHGYNLREMRVWMSRMKKTKGKK